MILKFEEKAMEDVPTGAAKAKATRDRRARTVNCMFAVGSIDLEVEREIKVVRRQKYTRK
jgi:hypothetical protein